MTHEVQQHIWSLAQAGEPAVHFLADLFDRLRRRIAHDVLMGAALLMLVGVVVPPDQLYSLSDDWVLIGWAVAGSWNNEFKLIP